MDARAQQVDELFTRWAKSDSPGCAVAVWQGDQVVYRQGYGMANLEYHIPITPATIFHVASVSKQFAAAAILLLQRDGLLSVSDDVRKTIPELHDFGTPITIDHLIHHISGLRDQWELLIAAGWRMEDVITTDDILSLIFAQRELNFAPGAEYRYCNTGYTLMGLIVERVSGKTLRQFCAERIFAPLGMTSTHFHDDYQEIVPNRAYSYSEKDGGGFKHSHLLYGTVGATSLFTTVADLLRWEANFFNPRVGDAAFIEQMTRRPLLNDGQPIPYAAGLVVRDYRGVRSVEHSGGDAGYRTFLIHYPDHKLAITVLSNLASVKPGVLAQKIADIYLADHLSAPVPTIMLAEAELPARAGWYHSAAVHETLHLTVESGVLQVDGWLKLTQLDAQHFISADSAHTQVNFSADGTSLTFEDGIGRGVPYERVEPLTLTLDRLSEYIGVYHCPELDADYEIVLDSDTLALKRRKYGAVKLIGILPDSFVEAKTDFDLRFSRDATNAVSGFQRSNGRVRNLNFVRKAG
ncbi:MAG TPA: serine hydrolase domain-containing protein [Phototrophicaceae bacterium]|nr:serine hydrolase domain-containing protein [Phototrophicaceae bacterium]